MDKKTLESHKMAPKFTMIPPTWEGNTHKKRRDTQSPIIAQSQRNKNEKTSRSHEALAFEQPRNLDWDEETHKYPTKPKPHGWRNRTKTSRRQTKRPWLEWQPGNHWGSIESIWKKWKSHEGLCEGRGSPVPIPLSQPLSQSPLCDTCPFVIYQGRLCNLSISLIITNGQVSHNGDWDRGLGQGYWDRDPLPFGLPISTV